MEWSSDAHCPHGDTSIAKSVAVTTKTAGLTVAAYGSYYRLGASEEQGLTFASVLASAVALGAPAIRIWAGAAGSAETTPKQRNAVIADARRISLLAAAAKVRVLTEWHAGTLTDTGASGRAFLTDVGQPNFGTVWQPGIGLDPAVAEAELTAVLPWVEHLHVFHWRTHERRPLAEGAAAWRRYLALAATTGKVTCAALEFVRGDEPAQLGPDAATLNTLLREIAK